MMFPRSVASSLQQQHRRLLHCREHLRCLASLSTGRPAAIHATPRHTSEANRYVRQNAIDNLEEWSRSMSSASSHPGTASDGKLDGPSWSGSFSYASPEADFVGQSARDISKDDRLHLTDQELMKQTNTRAPEWSQDMSFATPESDFVSSQSRNANEDEQSWFERVMSSNATDSWRSYGVQQGDTILASPESASGFVHMAEILDHKTLEQYARFERDSRALVDQNLVHVHLGQEHMPHTITEALEDPRAIVITSMSSPFVVFDVNDAWTDLCGYTREEALDRNLSDLLQGPRTDTKVARSMVGQLRETNYSEAVLKNYTKDGREFLNHIQLGRLSTSDGASDFFVGVLSEISKAAGNKYGDAEPMYQYA